MLYYSMIMPVSLSPNFTNLDFPKSYTEWSLEEKIKLFEDQVLGWKLKIADEIINDPDNRHPHAAFAVLSIILNYFEMIGGFLEGCRGETSFKHFKSGLIYVFPSLKESKDVIEILYKEVRCGMYHIGITGKKIILSRNNIASITLIPSNAEKYISINPHELTKHLINNFNEYIKSLKNTEDVTTVKNFIKRLNHLKRN